MVSLQLFVDTFELIQGQAFSFDVLSERFVNLREQEQEEERTLGGDIGIGGELEQYPLQDLVDGIKVRYQFFGLYRLANS